MKRLLIFIAFLIFIPFFIVKIYNKNYKEIKLHNVNSILIRVKRQNNNVIDSVPLEEYIVGVLAGEMPINFEIEALKAQAVASRSYALYRINKKNEYRLLPIISFLKAIPTLAFILIFIIYVKFSYIYIITLLIIPIVYQATTSAISFNNNRYKNTFLIRNGKTDLHSIFKVLLPSSLVEITNSFIQSFSLGLKAQVLVESFSSKSNFRGLGKLIYLSFQNSETLDMYSMILIIVIFSLLIDLLLTFIRNTIEKRNTNQKLI